MGRPLSRGSSFPDFAAAASANPHHHRHHTSTSSTVFSSDAHLRWPFGSIDSLSRDELRETAYELFFTSCRSSPGFGGRTSPAYNSDEGAAVTTAGAKGGGGGPVGGGGANMAVTSRIKKVLGLRTRKATATMRVVRELASGGSPGRVRQRPMTSAEIMRQQMGVTEQSDNRLRKTLARTLVGQTGRKAETMVLPLELLRQVKPSEFNDLHEYHRWQRRQLKVLEAGLSLHPSTPLDRLNSAALRLHEVVHASELKPIDTTKNSEAMRTLCNAVAALAWRSSANSAGTAAEVCHWADGYPLNIHLYLSLLHSVFDLRDESVVLDEVDELIELVKKTWTILGINRMIHNVCFTWVLFEQYIMTGQIEPDLMSATLVMVSEVAADAKRADREPGFVKILSATLGSLQDWAEKKLMDYHEGFQRGTLGTMENVLCFALSIAKIIKEDLPSLAAGMMMDRDDSLGVRVDQYIRSSLKTAFTKVFEKGSGYNDSMIVEVEEDPNEILLQLAKEIEALAISEKESFSPVLKRWHPVPTAVAVVTLHKCFAAVLKQYLARISSLSNESIKVLQSAGRLEKVLVQLAMEDCSDREDGGKGILREMVPFEIDSVIMSLIKNWITERLRIGRECYNRAKETESWNPKSKSEPYAQSAVDMMKLAKVTVDEFFAIPVPAREDLVEELADGWEALFLDYTAFVASCGTKQSYLPTLPPLTRCNQEPKFVKLWKKAATCHAGINCPRTQTLHSGPHSAEARRSPRPSASRGTQRLYVRLNTLHYLLAHVHSIDKTLSFFSRGGGGVGGGGGNNPSPQGSNRRRIAPTRFDAARSSIQSTILHVAEVAAYRLVFVDCHTTLYGGLYLGGVAEARVHPALRVLKQNLTLLVAVLTDRAQPMAVREVMKASFDAFMFVLVAGGSGRAFARWDSETVAEDFRSLKKTFCTCGEGLVAEEVVEREAQAVEAIVAMMGQPTERLVEDFTTAAYEAYGHKGLGGSVMHKLSALPKSGRWSRSDPSTTLRVLCHRDDDAASWFLKKTFQLPRRR